MELLTSRLRLFTLDDCAKAPLVLDYFKRNKSFLSTWEIVRDDSFYTLQAQQDMLFNDLNYMACGQLVKLWISRLGEEDRIIGSVALSNIVYGAFLSCHLGYRLDGEEEGKGYMTEALQALIDYAFQELKLHRIEANIMPQNAASFRVVEKLGFCHEGLARKYLKINGKWEDHVHMVLLNEEIE
ncbi:GNAT family N-acetyltransferase [Paenibacillus sp. 1011MAR3C5]|uniref:GNAT family N-acetyltransferase n=1 Tax=Paenibacillus sp. 1011MAR3C5 TaxID=1675787 RepID=UPI000E6D2998|nr:GNAT family N-acetyltransferase [Paenibacillus sp. 1011MAR3C5]RJE90329.1 GNAT family N-acetyltransferase [Paenibacillus sp. 1011MAR3C5]